MRASILDMPEDRATAERGNPLRHGVTAGYALGRYKAVTGSEDVQHPRAFADVALMPPPPPRDQCSLPNPRLIAMKPPPSQPSQGRTHFPPFKGGFEVDETSSPPLQ